jgi:hypothetical protein
MGHQLDSDERVPLRLEVEELTHVEVKFSPDEFPFVYREEQLILQDLIGILFEHDQLQVRLLLLGLDHGRPDMGFLFFLLLLMHHPELMDAEHVLEQVIELIILVVAQEVLDDGLRELMFLHGVLQHPDSLHECLMMMLRIALLPKRLHRHPEIDRNLDVLITNTPNDEHPTEVLNDRFQDVERQLVEVLHVLETQDDRSYQVVHRYLRFHQRKRRVLR